MTLRVKVQRLDEGVPLPGYAHSDDAGLDLVAAEQVTLKPGDRALVGCGIAVAIPAGYAGFVQPRSGLAIKKGLGVLNSPGLIDAGYRGEVKVIVVNLDPTDPITIERGDKVAQLVILQVPQVSLEVVDELPSSQRGAGGFGSTGR